MKTEKRDVVADLAVAAFVVALLIVVLGAAYGIEVVRARIWADALQKSGCRQEVVP